MSSSGRHPSSQPYKAAIAMVRALPMSSRINAFAAASKVAAQQCSLTLSNRSLSNGRPWAPAPPLAIMARLRVSEKTARNSSARPQSTPRDESPASGSDKENTSISATPKARHVMAGSRQDVQSPRSTKRRRLAETTPGTRLDSAEITAEPVAENSYRDSEDRSLPQTATSAGSQYYDPHQPLSERQELRKGMRELNNEAIDNRQAWIQPDNDSLSKAITRSDQIYHRVKQTSDATIDSRFLVTAGDIAYRRTTNMVMGDTSQGIDVDEFMGKAIALMRRGAPQSRSRNAALDSDDEDGDSLDWAKLGRVCFRSNRRPPLPSFLLGPLDVRKKIRQVNARSAANATQRNVAETRPEEVDQTQMGKTDTGPTAMSSAIHKVIRKSLRQIDRWIEQKSEEGWPEADISNSLVEQGFSSEGMIPLFKLVANPRSFGQTVENMFYVSFLIKDGLYGLDMDRDGTLCIVPGNDDDDADLGGNAQHQSSALNRRQAIFELDYALWRDIVDTYGIEQCLIPDRSKQEAEAAAAAKQQLSTGGWYR